MAHGNVNNNIKVLMSFLKISVQKPTKDRHTDIKTRIGYKDAQVKYTLSLYYIEKKTRG
jgi:hypothetical protein